MAPPEDPEAAARDIALRQLAAAPRTRAQLRGAMARRNVPDDAAETALDRLEEVGLVDDNEYARAWVASRHTGRGLARRALAQELRSRGVAADVAEDALDQVSADDELDRARDLVARRLPATRGLPREARIRRLAGMLARKGYPTGAALRVVRDALATEGEDADEMDDAAR